MKSATLIVLFALFVSAPTAQAAICLRVGDIKSTDSPDGKALVVTMKDGKVWRNQLQRSCPGLRFSGFSWNVDSGQICENAQSIRLVETGMICSLGKFSEVSAAGAKK